MTVLKFCRVMIIKIPGGVGSVLNLSLSRLDVSFRCNQA